MRETASPHTSRGNPKRRAARKKPFGSACSSRCYAAALRTVARRDPVDASRRVTAANDPVRSPQRAKNQPRRPPASRWAIVVRAASPLPPTQRSIHPRTRHKLSAASHPRSPPSEEKIAATRVAGAAASRERRSTSIPSLQPGEIAGRRLRGERVEPGRFSAGAFRAVERAAHRFVEPIGRISGKSRAAASSRTITSLCRPLINGCASFAGIGRDQMHPIR